MPTSIAFKCPEGTYCRITPRSGLTIKNNLTTLADTINPNYMGEIIIVLYNFVTKIQTVTQGQRIAQVIFEYILHPTVQIVNQLPTTSRLTMVSAARTNSQLHQYQLHLILLQLLHQIFLQMMNQPININFLHQQSIIYTVTLTYQWKCRIIFACLSTPLTTIRTEPFRSKVHIPHLV